MVLISCRLNLLNEKYIRAYFLSGNWNLFMNLFYSNLMREEEEERSLLVKGFPRARGNFYIFSPIFYLWAIMLHTYTTIFILFLLTRGSRIVEWKHLKCKLIFFPSSSSSSFSFISSHLVSFQCDGILDMWSGILFGEKWEYASVMLSHKRRWMRLNFGWKWKIFPIHFVARFSFTIKMNI